MLNIASEVQIASGWGGRSMWGDVNVVVDVVGTWDQKNKWGGDFDPKYPNTRCTHLVLVWGWKWPVLELKGVHGMGIQQVRGQETCKVKSSRGRQFDPPKTNFKCENSIASRN
jgi:hypothetical protein